MSRMFTWLSLSINNKRIKSWISCFGKVSYKKQICHCFLQRWHNSHLNNVVNSWSYLHICTSSIMFYTKICCDSSLANEGKELFWQHLRSIHPINKVGIWMLAQTSGLIVMWLTQHNLTYERAKCSTTLCPNHFALPIGFHCNSKDASIFYLMSSGSCGFKYL
jgi:hypothetical protein